MKSINLETILDQFDKHKTISEAQKSDILPAMKEACRQTLELAAKNAEVKVDLADMLFGKESYNVDKESIKNTINQIEIYETS